MVKMPPLVGYIRVSTKRQGRSGLGLEAQQEALDAYRRQNGGRVLATYKEIETGKTADRPELAKAIAHASDLVPRWLSPSWIGSPEMLPSFSRSKRRACQWCSWTCPAQTNSQLASWLWWPSMRPS